MTDAEQALWQRLRRKQILGLQFYRQKPLLNFIVDFYCPSAQLIIECDGSQHHSPNGLIADQERDKQLNALGFQVLRFDNRQILLEIETVCQIIFVTAQKTTQKLEN
mgnify:FL=1